MRPLTMSLMPCLAALVMLVGCVPAGNTTDQPLIDGYPFVDPTINPAAPMQPCYPNDNCPNCPDGNCPYPNYQAESCGTEVNTNGDTLVNVDAANEPKGQCPTCPRPTYVHPRPIPLQTVPVQSQRYQPANGYWPPIQLRPGETLLSVGRPVQRRLPQANAMPAPDGFSSAYLMPRRKDPESREGAFACQRCGRPTVGRQWHEVWADDDTPLTCLCETCWRSISPATRAAELQHYALGRLRGNLSPIVKDAIREAAQQ